MPKAGNRSPHGRRIGGHIYHIQSFQATKADAQKEAAWVRRHGHLARVMTNTSPEYKYKWAVWTS